MDPKGGATLACGWGGRGKPIRTTGDKAWHSVYYVTPPPFFASLFIITVTVSLPLYPWHLPKMFSLFPAFKEVLISPLLFRKIVVIVLTACPLFWLCLVRWNRERKWRLRAGYPPSLLPAWPPGGAARTRNRLLLLIRWVRDIRRQPEPGTRKTTDNENKSPFFLFSQNDVCFKRMFLWSW